jgi:hypothetical protein
MLAQYPDGVEMLSERRWGRWKKVENLVGYLSPHHDNKTVEHTWKGHLYRGEGGSFSGESTLKEADICKGHGKVPDDRIQKGPKGEGVGTTG